MPRDLRKLAALALRLALRTEDKDNHERLIVAAAENLEEAIVKEQTEEIIPVQAVAAPESK
jgi:hypothetical protein